jgi:hypothetical protein
MAAPHGQAKAQTWPQVVPSQVAVSLAATGQATQDDPQLGTLVLETQSPAQL